MCISKRKDLLVTFSRSLQAVGLFVVLISSSIVAHGDEPAFTRTQDVIYGRKLGTALTMDVFTPEQKQNGAAVVIIVSGGWVSSHDNIDASFWKGLHLEFLRRDYVVFA